MAAAKFIVSLDCEGKWGMADCLTEQLKLRLTNAALEQAYRRLLSLLKCYEVAATFAFVTAFTMSESEYRSYQDLFVDVDVGGVNWLAAARHDLAAGRSQGWLAPGVFELVAGQPQHELASHGFCHLPLAEHLVSRDCAAREIDALVTVCRDKNWPLSTFVYPRNLVGYEDLLTKAGFAGYRDRRVLPPGGLGQLARLATEFNVWQRPQPPAVKNDLVAIPAGYFFNWRSGVRKTVPPVVTAMRWRNLLKRAVHTGEVVHLWLHPHNLIGSDATYDVLRTVLAAASAHRDRGEIDILTQHAYCQTV